MGLVAELRRRNVLRMAVLYIVAAWLVMQVAGVLMDLGGLPAAAGPWLLAVLVIGFPIALFFSWFYELTPEGLALEKDVPEGASITHVTGRRMDFIVIAVLSAGLILFAYDKWWPREPLESSIAVLPFADLSPDGDQEYFSDGLSEELLNVLARIPDVQVAGRTSSFAFKGQNRDLREIGEVLNVAYVLEGSVRKAGNKIRVTAQLVNAESGFHLYSDTYDRDLTEVFAVQDEIATAIASALSTELVGATVQETVETSIDVYDLYLVARQKIYTRNLDEMKEASRLLDQALEMDADYAPALAQKALVLMLMSDNMAYGDIPAEEAGPAARHIIDRALAIDPKLAEAHAVSGWIMLNEKHRSNAEAVEVLEYALRLNPNLDNARNWLAIAHKAAGRHDEARALWESVVERDPMYGPAFANLIQHYLRTRDFDLANALVGRVERIVGETDTVIRRWALIALEQGDIARAIRHYRKVYERSPLTAVTQSWYVEALYRIGEYESSIEVNLSWPQWVVRGLDQLGRYDEAQAVLDATPARSSPGNNWNNWNLLVRAEHYVVTGQYDEAIRYVEENFESLDAMLQRFERTDGSNSSYLAPLAYCYLQAGRDLEFKFLTDALAENLARQEVAGRSSATILRSIDLAALTATDEEVLIQVQRLVDNNGVDVNMFYMPWYDRMADNAEFRRLNAILVKRANDERAKLGFDPYQRAVE